MQTTWHTVYYKQWATPNCSRIFKKGILFHIYRYRFYYISCFYFALQTCTHFIFVNNQKHLESVDCTVFETLLVFLLVLLNRARMSPNLISVSFLENSSHECPVTFQRLSSFLARTSDRIVVDWNLWDHNALHQVSPTCHAGIRIIYRVFFRPSSCTVQSGMVNMLFVCVPVCLLELVSLSTQ